MPVYDSLYTENMPKKRSKRLKHTTALGWHEWIYVLGQGSTSLRHSSAKSAPVIWAGGLHEADLEKGELYPAFLPGRISIDRENLADSAACGHDWRSNNSKQPKTWHVWDPI